MTRLTVSENKAVRVVHVSLTLLMILLFVMAAGSVWHHHHSANGSNCPMCQLGHHPVAQAQAIQRLPALELVGPYPITRAPIVLHEASSLSTPTRAPPSA